MITKKQPAIPNLENRLAPRGWVKMCTAHPMSIKRWLSRKDLCGVLEKEKVGTEDDTNKV